MYEHHFEFFKFISTDTPYCAIELTKEPFVGLKLFLGKEFVFKDVGTDEQSMQFDYDIFDRPEGFTEDHVTQELLDLITGIFLAILEKKMDKAVAEELNHERPSDETV